MAKFTKLNPKDVALGRGRATAEARKPYIEAVRSGQAGKIELTRGEQSATVTRLPTPPYGRGQLGDQRAPASEEESSLLGQRDVSLVAKPSAQVLPRLIKRRATSCC